LQWPIDNVLSNLEALFRAAPPPAFLLAVTLLAWRFAGRRIAIFAAIVTICFDVLGLWDETMTTVAMVLTALVFCAGVGLPLGIIAGRSDRFAAVIRPILDIMQTIPAFVYLVPIVMLFGIGIVPAILATIIFALPPMIRLTSLGIRQVPREILEAGVAFGSTPWQLLWEVQLPLAKPTIMAGINQCLMLALSMVVIAALVGAGGLGMIVFTSIGRLDVGMATVSGLCIVLLAILLDRITLGIGGKTASAAPAALRRQVARTLFKFAPRDAEGRVWPPRSDADFNEPEKGRVQ
jgi:glycine betaine/proline transport system permease protein